MQSFSLAISLLLSVAARQGQASCAYGTSLHKRVEGQVPVNTFGYAGAISPLNWLSLDAANVACSTGRSQSPIDMREGQFTVIPAANLQLNIPDIAETEFENLGTTVEVIVPEGSGAGIVVDGTPFALKQFHFHLPSEHLDNGTSFAMEMHMVHESANQEIAVVGVYLDAGGMPIPAIQTAPVVPRREHARDTAKRQEVPVGGGVAIVGAATGATALFDTIFASAGSITTPGTKTAIGPLAMSGLLSSLQAGEFQAYGGSLTTPPCSEGVRWFVSTAKQMVSLPAFVAARDVIGFNSRFPQNALGQENVIALAAASSAGIAAQQQQQQVVAPAEGVPAA